jgi:hypothetical protein
VGSGVDPFYGVVEAVLSSAETGATSLAATATSFREQHYPAPLKVNLPQGSVLSCDAPFDIAELVAGVTVPFKVEEGICRTVIATQQLTNVNVVQDKDGEKVAVTVAPLTGVLT